MRCGAQWDGRDRCRRLRPRILERCGGSDALIRPGVGIGGVKLGMTVAQVRKALGAPSYTNEQRSVGFGQRYVELDWGPASWTVGLQGRPGKLRAVKVATTLLRQRTHTGLGRGSRIRDILRVYPQAACPAS